MQGEQEISIAVERSRSRRENVLTGFASMRRTRAGSVRAHEEHPRTRHMPSRGAACCGPYKRDHMNFRVGSRRAPKRTRVEALSCVSISAGSCARRSAFAPSESACAIVSVSRRGPLLPRRLPRRERFNDFRLAAACHPWSPGMNRCVASKTTGYQFLHLLNAAKIHHEIWYQRMIRVPSK